MNAPRSRIPRAVVRSPTSRSVNVRVREAVSRALSRRPTPPARRNQKPKKNDTFDLNKIFSDISSTFSNALGNPLVLCTIVLAIGLIVTHDHSKKNGFIYDTLKNNTDVVSKWVVSNGVKFTGLVIFVPSVLDSPRNYRTLLALLSFFWVMIIPESKPAEYFLQSLALHTYFRLKNQKSKLFVMLGVAVAYMLGYFKLQ